ncbi:MAG: nucleoside recognition domain-containing protein [Saezia sp.]
MSKDNKLKVPIAGYIALIFALIYFSGLMSGWGNSVSESVLRSHFTMILEKGDAPTNVTDKLSAYIKAAEEKNQLLEAANKEADAIKRADLIKAAEAVKFPYANAKALIGAYEAEYKADVKAYTDAKKAAGPGGTLDIQPPKEYVLLSQTWKKYVDGFFKAFDFSTLQGSFSTIAGSKHTFVGSGDGVGAKAGFLFALTLLPAVMLALGLIELIEHYGGLKAAQKLLTPILRPILGLPGVTGLALISSLQSTDAGASMTRNLRDEGLLTENERTIFGMFQFSGGAMITNFLGSGAAIYVFVMNPNYEGSVPAIIGISLAVILVFKILAANLMRLYVKKFGEDDNV